MSISMIQSGVAQFQRVSEQFAIQKQAVVVDNSININNTPVDRVEISPEAIQKAAADDAAPAAKTITTKTTTKSDPDSTVDPLLQSAKAGNARSVQKLKTLSHNNDPKMAQAAQAALRTLQQQK